MKSDRTDSNERLFTGLFMEVCEKCLGSPLTSVLSETDSKVLSSEIFEHTGLVIGAKSLRNYSLYVLQQSREKRENPSVATLDTLARYMLGAPRTDEIQRKATESHFPYWHQYRKRCAKPGKKGFIKSLPMHPILLYLFLLLVTTGVIALLLPRKVGTGKNFFDNFGSVREDSMLARGWYVRNVDREWWDRRDKFPGCLSLFTLRGDNWSLGDNDAQVRNLVTREIPGDCFTTEIHLVDFIPGTNWQQAGLLIAEDSSLESRAVRMSIAYNDFFGGYEKPPEIIIQVVASAESGIGHKPEEIVHIPLFAIEKGREDLVSENLRRSALRIEWKGEIIRFLYATGSMENFAFKVAYGGKLNIRPAFISLFAIQGWSESQSSIPAQFDSFGMEIISCE